MNSDFIEDEEVQVGSFGGEITRGLLGNLGAADTTLVLTDARVLPRTTGKDVTVITAGTPADEELPPWVESSDD